MADGPDVLDLLAADHERISAGLAGEDGDLDVTREISMHLYAEEEVLYAALRRDVSGGDDLADDMLAVDHELKALLADLEEKGLSGRTAAVAALFARHVAGVEAMASTVRAEIDGPERNRLADVLLAAVREAPTHPHPHLIDHGAMQPIADAAASAVDHLRDAVRRDQRPS